MLTDVVSENPYVADKHNEIASTTNLSSRPLSVGVDLRRPSTSRLPATIPSFHVLSRSVRAAARRKRRRKKRKRKRGKRRRKGRRGKGRKRRRKKRKRKKRRRKKFGRRRRKFRKRKKTRRPWRLSSTPYMSHIILKLTGRPRPSSRNRKKKIPIFLTSTGQFPPRKSKTHLRRGGAAASHILNVMDSLITKVSYAIDLSDFEIAFFLEIKLMHWYD